MGKRIITSLLVSLFVSISLFADEYIDKQTYVYSVKDGSSLKLDRYYLKDDEAVAVKVTPCIVFMFEAVLQPANVTENSMWTIFISW